MYVYSTGQANHVLSLFRKHLCTGGWYLFISWHSQFSKLAKIFTVKDSPEPSAGSNRGLVGIMKPGSSFLPHCYYTSWLSAQHPQYYCTVMCHVHGKDLGVSHLLYMCTHALYYLCSWEVAYVSKHFCHLLFSVSRIYSVYDWPVWSLLWIPPW